MTRGIRNAQIAVVIVIAGSVLLLVAALVMGNVEAAGSVLTVLVVLLAWAKLYRDDPSKYHEPITRREVAQAVLPLVAIIVLIVVGSAVAVLVER